MTRKHFQLIAEALGKAYGHADLLYDIEAISVEDNVARSCQMQAVIAELNHAFSCENPRFDTERFREAVYDASREYKTERLAA